MSKTSTSRPDTAEPVAAVRRYIEGINKGDVKAMAATCAVPMSILDGMAPHVWHGPTASEDWYRDAMTEGEHLGAADYSVALGEPLHVQITGDSAYVLVPATMKFKLRGHPITQSGATFTVALHKSVVGWRIAAKTRAMGTARPQA